MKKPVPLSESLSAPPGSSIAISSRDRVIFPGDGLTKGDLADYYLAVAPILLPWLANRPISLVRCPQGRARRCFFQKHDAGSFGAHVHHVDVREKDGSVEPYLHVDDADGILACVQMGTIEFHGWGSLAADIEKPDRLVFDLDPDEGLDWADVRKAAADLKEHLAEIGLTSWPMLTGGKGVHVVVPLAPKAEWPEARRFCERFARARAEAEPDRFTANLKRCTARAGSSSTICATSAAAPRCCPMWSAPAKARRSRRRSAGASCATSTAPGTSRFGTAPG